ncbi:NHL repeat-containing protein [Pontibacter pamirensis]|uniref:hypothetical protein n=1 Tax=Pontibacter pamirensis TaxID=2562824 RepID=UPI00138A0D42|nr:hypothetical protein [Pontibacter pamirensis]
MLIKLFTVYVYLQAMFCGCGSDRRNSDFVRLRKAYRVEVQRIGRLDSRISESSGLAFASDSTFWTHSDGGSLNELYLFNLKGELLQTVPLQVPNRDWEDLAEDEQGQLYIGDFGNNANNRQNLQVYKLQPETRTVDDTIRFSYADQTEFPPPRPERHYDLEGFLYHTDSLYLFTKSRALCKTITKRYSLPAKGGEYTLAPQEELRVKSPITAAAMSPAQDQFALLGYGRLYLFEMEDGRVNFSGKRSCLPIARTGQAEAILYLSPDQLLITNENGKMYLVTVSSKK